MILRRLLTGKRGQGLVEYTLILALVVLVIWVAITATGIDTTISELWNNVGSTLEDAPS